MQYIAGCLLLYISHSFLPTLHFSEQVGENWRELSSYLLRKAYKWLLKLGFSRHFAQLKMSFASNSAIHISPRAFNKNLIFCSKNIHTKNQLVSSLKWNNLRGYELHIGSVFHILTICGGSVHCNNNDNDFFQWTKNRDSLVNFWFLVLYSQNFNYICVMKQNERKNRYNNLPKSIWCYDDEVISIISQL